MIGRRFFPYSQYRSVRLYYALTVCLNAWFIAAVWYFVWRHFMNNTQIGLSDGITFGAGFLFELPSGIWADFVGRHKAVRLGYVGMLIGNILVAFGSSFWAITIGFLIWTLGQTFQSGALDALVYDDLLKRDPKRIETSWPQIVARAQMYAKTVTMIATLLGGLLYSVWFRLPWTLMIAMSAIGLILALRLPVDQPQAHEHKAWHPAAYKGQLLRGLRVIFARQVRTISILALVVGSIDYVLSWGILRPLIGVRFGFTATTLPILQVVAAVGVIVALLLATRLLKGQRSLGRIVGVGALAYGLVFIMLGLLHQQLLGGMAFVVGEIVSAVVAVGFSVYINQHTESRHRATTLSAASLLERTPYAFLAILLGWLASKNLVGAFCVIVGGLVLFLATILLPKWVRHEATGGRL